MPIARYKDLCVDVRNVEAGERFWDQVPDYRLYEVVVDCTDPEPVARWWADVFGARRGVGRGGGWWWIDQIPDCLARPCRSRRQRVLRFRLRPSATLSAWCIRKAC
jgi:hypothetical protein